MSRTNELSLKLINCWMFLLSRRVGLLASGAKSEQAHHCAGLEGDSHPPAQNLRRKPQRGLRCSPRGQRSREKSSCWLIDSKGRASGFWKRPVSLKLRELEMQGIGELLCVGAIFSSCFSFQIVFSRKPNHICYSDIHFRMLWSSGWDSFTVTHLIFFISNVTQEIRFNLSLYRTTNTFVSRREVCLT